MVTKQIIFRLASPDGHILLQEGHHRRTQRDSLYFAIFVVAKQNLPCVQIHIPVLDIADRGRTASAVHQEINNDPVSIVAEGAVLFRLFQQSQQFIVCIRFLDGFLVFDVRQFGAVLSVPLAPIQEGAKRRNGVVCQSCLTHRYHHCLQIPFGQRIHWLLDIQMFGDAVDMTAICGDGGFRQSLCGLGNYEIIEHFLNGFAGLSR